MRTIINYLKSCFCKHEWELIFNVSVSASGYGTYDEKTYRCKKCGYSKKYKSN